jgi:tetratricopeptide (TPR) repeat protein
MRRFWVSSLFSFGCFLTAVHVFAAEVHQYPACNKQPTDTEVQGAKGAFQAGLASYDEADYGRAILYWEDAYRRDCTATLLLHHLSRAYEGQGNLEQAAIALRTYLERSPGLEDAELIQKRLELIAEKLLEERKRADEAKRQRDAEANRKSLPAPTVSSNSGSSLYVNPLIPIAVASVGAVATVVGAVIYFPAKSDLNDAENACPDRKDCEPNIVTQGNDARTKVNWGGALAVTGLVLAAGGVGWYFFNEGQEPKKTLAMQPNWQPWVSSKSAGMLWQGRF